MNPNEQEFEQVMRTHKATIYTVCYMFLWVLVFCWQSGIFDHELSSSSTKGLVSLAIGVFFGLLICFGFFFCEMHRVNQSVSEIDELAKD